ncbi:MAG: hypothetical protein R3F62_05345 [Planctomycetota bacterium]
MRRRLLFVSSYLTLAVVALWATQAQGSPSGPRARFEALDRDGDGRIGPDEFPGNPEQFARADRDGDGGLDLREAMLFKVLEDARQNPAKGRALRERFTKADGDGDGVITREEFPAPPALFERFDRDGDGQVVLAEALSFAVEEEVAKVFEQHDRDLSGTLDREEFPAEQRQNFELVDADEDGVVTGEEAYAVIHAVFEELVAAATQAPPAPSLRPGTTTAPAPAGALARLGERFAALDGDADGRLDAQEFPGSRAWRAELDRDGDGAVSRAELELAGRRAQRLIARALELKAQAEAQGLQGDPQGPLALEAQGLLAAGRLGDLEALLNEVELRLLERQ